MKLSKKIIATATVSALAATAAIATPAAYAEENQQVSVDSVIINVNGKQVIVFLSDYGDALLGENPELLDLLKGDKEYSEVSHVLVGGKYLSLEEYGDLILEHGSVTEAALKDIAGAELKDLYEIKAGEIVPIPVPIPGLEVESVSAINANQISVTFDNEETVTIDLTEALVDGATTVSFEYNGQTFTDVALDAAYVAPDTEPPVLTVDGETTVNVENGAEVVLPAVTATDNKDESVEVTSVITNAAGEVVEAIDTTVAGTYRVTYSAVDAAGNAAENVVVTVVVAEAPLKVESVSAINATTLSVTFEGSEEDVEVTLEEALTHGQTEVIFVYKEDTYEATLDTPYVDQAVVDAEALAAAIEAAEEAIADLPEVITLAEKQDVEDAALLVAAVYALDEEAVIAGIETLEAAQATIETLLAEEEATAELAAAKTAAEEAIADLPTVEELTLDDAQAVADARELVAAYVDLGGVDTDVEGLDALEALEDQLEVLQAQADFNALVADAQDKVDALTLATSSLTKLDTQAKIDDALVLVGTAEEAIVAITTADADADVSTLTDAVEVANANIAEAGLVLEATTLVETAKETKLDVDYDAAKEKVDALKTSQQRTDLNAELIELQSERNAIIQTIVGAGTNQIQLAEALQNEIFKNVKPANIQKYAELVSVAATAPGASLTTIQNAINAANTAVADKAAETAAIEAVSALFAEPVTPNTATLDVDTTQVEIDAAKVLVEAALGEDFTWEGVEAQTGSDTAVAKDNMAKFVVAAQEALDAANQEALEKAIIDAADTNNQVELKTLLNQANLQVDGEEPGSKVDVAVKNANIVLYTAAINAATAPDLDDIATLVNDVNKVKDALTKNVAKAAEVTEVGQAQSSLEDKLDLVDQAIPELATELGDVDTLITNVETAITAYNDAVTDAQTAITAYDAAVASAADYSDVDAVETALTNAATAKTALDAKLAGTAGVKTTADIINATTKADESGLTNKTTLLTTAVTNAKNSAEGAAALETAKANYEAAATKAEAVGLVVDTGDFAAAFAEFDKETPDAVTLQGLVDTLNNTIAINEAIQADNASNLAKALIKGGAEVNAADEGNATLFADLSPAQKRLEVAQALIDATVEGTVYNDVSEVNDELQGAENVYAKYLDTLAALNKKAATNSEMLATLKAVGYETASIEDAEAFLLLLDTEGFNAFTNIQAAKTAFESL